ncbi:MAG TPA: hypothetical protein VK249_25540 [Anaerolineales bacterium]|nr:hypothetical protein [Anaerolineales bacterium]
MKEKPEPIKDVPVKRSPLRWKQTALLAAVLAVIQACLTINGRGIEGFILWIVILFVIYWLLFTFLVWLWGVLKKRA